MNNNDNQIVQIENMDKILVDKFFKKEEKYNNSDLELDFRSPNIVKPNKIYDERLKKTNGKIYNLKDVTILVKILREKNFLNLVFKYPFDMIGDNFARFIIKQLLRGFETLYMANYIHFDFNPESTLIFNKLVVKLSNFHLLRNLNKIKNNENKVEIPGGTPGYFPPEYYSNEDHKITVEEAFKFDYFSLGATIFYLKYGKKMLNYQKFEDDLITAIYLKELIQNTMNRIKTSKENNKDFINFLCKLIQYNPKDRLSFEEIYRNKWLNKNRKQILEIEENFKKDEEKIIIELNKSDFLFEKNKYINAERKMLDKISINDKANLENYENNNKINYHKFKLKL